MRFNVVPELLVLVGIPGSGKTYCAKRMLEYREKAGRACVHLSSDAIRGELFGDESLQKDHNLVFQTMNNRAVEYLNSGFDVIYDATSLTRKSRASALAMVPKHVLKCAFVVWAPIEVCIERDAARERTVGAHVIDKCLRRFEMPFYDEGFDDIKVYQNIGPVTIEKESEYAQQLKNAMHIPHDNPHHTFDVFRHCNAAGSWIAENEGKCFEVLPEYIKKDLIFAAHFHDCGKPYCKTFTNRKGEATDIAHYYDHQAVGAYLACGLRSSTIFSLWLISSHMAPFINRKYYDSLPEGYRAILDILHDADLNAH